EALDLFDEVYDQVASYYVDPMTITSYVAHGTESLYLALANDRYMERNAHNADPQRVARFRKLLREQYWNKPIPQRSMARQTISQVCDIAKSELGLPETAVVME